MFNFSTSALGASVRVFAGAAAAAVMIAATPAAADPLFIKQAFWFDATARGDHLAPMDVVISPYKIQAGADASGPLTDYLAFCIQLNVKMFHDGEDLGGIGDVINQNYADDDLLSTADLAAVSKLVAYGTDFFSGLPSMFGSFDDFLAASDELASVQAAIWKITDGATVVFNDAVFGPSAIPNGLRTELLFTEAYGTGNELDAFTGATIRTVYTESDGRGGYLRQGLAFVSPATAPVPEPMSWVLMISGFAMSGAILRRRRAVAAN